MHNWQGRGNCAPLYNVSFMLFPYISSLIFHPFIFHLTSQQYVNTVRKGCGKEKEWYRRKSKDDIQLHHQILTFLARAPRIITNQKKSALTTLTEGNIPHVGLIFLWSHDHVPKSFQWRQDRFFREPHRGRRWFRVLFLITNRQHKRNISRPRWWFINCITLKAHY